LRSSGYLLKLDEPRKIPKGKEREREREKKKERKKGGEDKKK